MTTTAPPTTAAPPTTNLSTFPDFTDPANPYFKPLKEQRTKLSNFYANFTTDLRQNAEDRVENEREMREGQNGIILFQRQCHQTLKKYVLNHSSYVSCLLTALLHLSILLT
jgi:hypothetical protein